MSRAPGKLNIWTVTDGRAGIAAQAEGLAGAIAALVPAHIKNITVEKKLLSGGKAGKPTHDMQPPWPDIYIGCGRASLPYGRAIGGWSEGKTLSVQLQDPRRALSSFDLIIPPTHDALSGANVFSIIGAPNTITPKALAAAQETFTETLDAFPAPRLAVLLGGKSKRHNFTKPLLKKLCRDLDTLIERKVSLLISTSRRTPDFVIRRLRRRYGKNPKVWLWTGHAKDGPNPYLAFLAAADAVLVSNDSTNLLTEAASAGKPILMLSLDGKDEKLKQLYDDLAQRGHVRAFTGALATWPVEPLDETARAAKEVVRRLYQHWQKNE